jgi:hypothetical protein
MFTSAFYIEIYTYEAWHVLPRQTWKLAVGSFPSKKLHWSYTKLYSINTMVELSSAARA